MKLSAYLEKHGWSVLGFANEAGITRNSIERILNGLGVTISTAARIVEASDGEVSFRDLVPSEEPHE